MFSTATAFSKPPVPLVRLWLCALLLCAVPASAQMLADWVRFDTPAPPPKLPASAAVAAASTPLPAPSAAALPAASAASSAVTTVTAALTKSTSPQWQDLTKAQQDALRPLAQTWASLPASHKSKWIALAQNYGRKAPAEQEKMQSRMAEWAALKPAQRDLARLTFAETKKLAPAERAADWQAYKALSQQEKKRLAVKALASKPTGAALAITPVARGRITPVLVTRHTPPDALVARPRLDPNTLLPLPR